MIKSLKNKKIGFTLAEVLVTLAVIGIVASLTVPSLLKNYQEASGKAAWKKKFSEINQAFLNMQAKEGRWVYNITEYPDYTYMDEFFCQKFSKYLKYIKLGEACTGDNTDRYWHKDGKWKTKDGRDLGINGNYAGLSMVMADGSIFLFHCTENMSVDINGKSGPNILGTDIFVLSIDKTTGKLSPAGSVIDWNNNNYPACSNGWDGYTSGVTPDQAEDDCLNGSGLGCSTYYLKGN